MTEETVAWTGMRREHGSRLGRSLAVFTCSAAITESHRLEGRNINLFLIVLEVENTKIKAPADSGADMNHLPSYR